MLPTNPTSIPLVVWNEYLVVPQTEAVSGMEKGFAKSAVPLAITIQVSNIRDPSERADSLNPSWPLPMCGDLATMLEPPSLRRQRRSTVEPDDNVVEELEEAGVEAAPIGTRLPDAHCYRTIERRLGLGLRICTASIDRGNGRLVVWSRRKGRECFSRGPCRQRSLAALSQLHFR
jgi:hypothetical protein